METEFNAEGSFIAWIAEMHTLLRQFKNSVIDILEVVNSRCRDILLLQ